MAQVALLWRACLAGDVPSMTSMIDRGLDPRQSDRNGENCVHMTARSGELGAVKLLTFEGLDLNSFNHNGQTALHIATTKDHKDIVEFIIENEGNTDITTKFSGMTALHMACKDESVGITRTLLDKGANCAIKDKIGKYPDFYTNDSTILSIFDNHFDVCKHGRGRVRGKDYSTDDMAHSPTRTEYDSDSQKKKKKESKEREREKPEQLDVEHRKVEIYDKMENYDHERAQQNWETVKRNGKKIKVNHGIDFSEEHKKRMQQNVFDRLMGGGKKK